MTAAKYPGDQGKPVGGNGNAFAILKAVVRAMRAAKLPDEKIKRFQSEAMSGDYDHHLQCACWVDVE